MWLRVCRNVKEKHSIRKRAFNKSECGPLSSSHLRDASHHIIVVVVGCVWMCGKCNVSPSYTTASSSRRVKRLHSLSMNENTSPCECECVCRTLISFCIDYSTASILIRHKSVPKKRRCIWTNHHNSAHQQPTRSYRYSTHTQALAIRCIVRTKGADLIDLNLPRNAVNCAPQDFAAIASIFAAFSGSSIWMVFSDLSAQECLKNDCSSKLILQLNDMHSASMQCSISAFSIKFNALKYTVC